MAPPSFKMANEDRVQRLLESRAKYSKLSQSKIVKAKDKLQPSHSNHVVSKINNSFVAKNNKTFNPPTDIEFVPDPLSLQQIKANKPIPRSTFGNVGRTSTFGRRTSVASRNSIAMPRVSCFPLGINLFEASREQIERAHEYIASNLAPGERNSIVEPKTPSFLSTSLTPAKTLRSATTTARRERVIRFQDNVILEQRESTDNSEDLMNKIESGGISSENDVDENEYNTRTRTNASTKNTPSKIPPDFVPTSILSKKSKRITNKSAALVVESVSTSSKKDEAEEALQGDSRKDDRIPFDDDAIYRYFMDMTPENMTIFRLRKLAEIGQRIETVLRASGFEKEGTTSTSIFASNNSATTMRSSAVTENIRSSEGDDRVPKDLRKKSIRQRRSSMMTCKTRRSRALSSFADEDEE